MVVVLEILNWKSVSINVRLIESKDMRYFYTGKMFNKKNDIIFIELPSII